MLVYGTAWKRERTADLVYAALRAGFRAVDTAAQPRHYREDFVADGVRRALADGLVARRADLYLQTKFTPPPGQDWGGTPDAADGPDDWRPPPYDRDAPLADQVRASVEASLRNFTFEDDPGPPYIDCLVLHAPLPSRAATAAVWEALAAYVPHRVRALGVSNVDAAALALVLDVARALDPDGRRRLAPVVVQNRFHRGPAHDPYDVALRRLCAAAAATAATPQHHHHHHQHHPPIVYQAFWTLTANRHSLLRHPASTAAVAAAARVSPEVALYSLVTSLGRDGTSPASCPVVVLDGTTDPAHMAADLAGLDQVAAWAQTPAGQPVWAAALAAFRQQIGDV